MILFLCAPAVLINLDKVCIKRIQKSLWSIVMNIFCWASAWACKEQTSYLSPISHIIYVEKKFPCGEFSAFHVWRLQGNKKILYMWRNFRCLPMTDVEKSEILHIWHVCDVENVAIYAKFMLFSWKKSVLSKTNFVAKSVLS